MQNPFPSICHRFIYLTLIIMTVLIFGLCIASCTSADEKKESKFRVMTANIGYCSLFERPSVQDWVDVLGDGPKADVVLLQDVQNTQQVADMARKLGYTSWITDAPYRQKGSDLAILSTRELADPMYLAFQASPSGKGALCANSAGQGKDVLVCSVHLDRVEPTPQIKDGKVDYPWLQLFAEFYREVFTSTVRSQSAGELVQWLDARGLKPIVVGGDFNTVPLSRTVRAMCRHFDDSLWPSWDFFQGTYKPFDFPIKPRIDYLFHSPELECLESRIMPTTAGDHFPVWAEFAKHGKTRIPKHEIRNNQK
ncbi:MAG: endonuclease/exonuclease/phosphatase family protein [Desulfovermiculus sp.]|nr:endonuclease/exonuclease/phosphatase family protein [Desulfovermiculus sp.]